MLLHVANQVRALLLITGRLDEALRKAAEAASVHEQLCGATHRWTKGAADVLVKVLIALGRVSEASQTQVHHELERPVAQTS
jgi:hypothetical protein